MRDRLKICPVTFFLAACLALWMLPSPHEARAEKKKQAQEKTGEAAVKEAEENPVSQEAIAHFQKGVGFFNEESFGAALVEFLKSYELHPNWALRYNIGICYVETGKIVEGLDEFRLYLEEGSESIDADRRKEVEDLIGEIEGKIGFVEIKADQQGATVILDDYKELDADAAGPVPLKAGLHTLVVKKGGFETVKKEFKLASGEKRVLEISLKPLASPVKPPSEKKPEPAAKQPEKLVKPKRWLWAGLGAGLALGAGAVVTGSLALVKRNDMRDTADGCDATAARSDCPEAYDLQEQARGLMIATNVLAGVAGAAAVAGLILFLLDKPGPAEEKPPPDGQSKGSRKKIARVLFGPALFGPGKESPGLQAWIVF
jgi:hypothetical protein